MITLFKKSNSQLGDELDQKLEDLILAYKVEELPDNSEEDLFIIESGNKIKGKEEIEEWLNQLEKEILWQRSITGDACYIDPETGETC